jgi:diadenosine tetraphosphate (Ap4A) HIT family hydrolase
MRTQREVVMDELEFCTDLEELTAREQVEHMKATQEMHRLMEQQFIRDCIELALDENTGLCAEDV